MVHLVRRLDASLALLAGLVLFAACSQTAPEKSYDPDGTEDPTENPDDPDSPWLPAPLQEINSEPAWSPDGTAIVYTHTAQSPEEQALGLVQLWLYSVADETTKYLAPGHSAAWCPDGQRVVYSGTTRLWILDLQTSQASLLTDFDFAFQPRWSPDGSHILIMRWAPSQSLWTIAPDGSDLQALGLSSFSADWSPSGDAIVFNSPDEHRLLTRDAPGGEVVTLLDSSPARTRYPRWAPDSSWIAYFRFHEGAFDLWVVRPDGSGARELIEGAKRASWSPDGRAVVYEKLDRVTSTYDLWLFSLDTETAVPLLSGQP